jgi:hypothetical protein
MTTQVPPPSTWHISQIIVDVLSPIMYACLFNQSKFHWLLSDVLNFAISICFQLSEQTRIFVVIIVWKRSSLLFLS